MRRVTLATILTDSGIYVHLSVSYSIGFFFFFLLKIENCREKETDYSPFLLILKSLKSWSIRERELQSVSPEGALLPIFISISCYYFICYVILILSRWFSRYSRQWSVLLPSVAYWIPNIILLNIVKGGHNWKKENTRK